ncbi:MAG: CDP-alcohol phosphatidyltransferase family protein [Patescibacteria group bacterium]|nr:CDP-alcohol phosphatidyltransferase family protein [Patescibacteria group bacterium]
MESAKGISIKELRARCQATAPAPERETFTGKKARFFSIYFTKLFLYTSITPNQITALSVLVFFLGVGLFLFQSRELSILGACLVFFATVLDGCDGEVARFRRIRSIVGGTYAEPISHDIQYGLMFLPLGLAASVFVGELWPMVVAFAASVGKLLTRLAEIRHWQLLHPRGVSDEERVASRQSLTQRSSARRFISWLKRNIFSSNGVILPLLLAAIFDKVHWYVAFYGVGYFVLWVLVFWRQLRQIKKMPGEGQAAD